MNWKTLVGGIVLIIVVGIAGFLYRNAVEHPSRPIACPLDAKLCPDGSSVGRIGSSCVFPVCPAPNIELENTGISFALPTGFAPVASFDAATIALYEKAIASTTEKSSLVINRYLIDASSTPLSVIQKTAIGGATGEPVPPTAFSSVQIGKRWFSMVTIERFEAVIHVAYYITRENDVLRFDAIDRAVTNWTSSGLNVNTLPANQALRELLSTLQLQ